jgi:hypothetical protein
MGLTQTRRRPGRWGKGVESEISRMFFSLHIRHFNKYLLSNEIFFHRRHPNMAPTSSSSSFDLTVPARTGVQWDCRAGLSQLVRVRRQGKTLTPSGSVTFAPLRISMGDHCHNITGAGLVWARICASTRSGTSVLKVQQIPRRSAQAETQTKPLLALSVVHNTHHFL